MVCLHLPFWKVWLSGNVSHRAFPGVFPGKQLFSSVLGMFGFAGGLKKGSGSVFILWCIYLLFMTGLSFHEGVQQIPGFPDQSSVHPALQPWYQQWAEEVGKVRALFSIPGEERVFGQAVIPIPKYLKCSKNPKPPNCWVNKWLEKTHVEKTAWNVFRPRSCKWRVGNTHLFHIFFGGMCVTWLVRRSRWGQGCRGY